MRLTLADWSIVALYFLFNVAVGLYYKRRAGRDTAEFFRSGRNVPWWLAGTSMVATTFAADTPLAVTGLVARNGVAGNWLWWNLLASGMLTVFFYARLWRRAGVMTDIEFSEIRYAGPPAAFLRGFRALYLGLLMNCIILGWVNLAMAKILQLVFGISQSEEHTSELQSLRHLVCRLLLEKKKNIKTRHEHSKRSNKLRESHEKRHQTITLESAPSATTIQHIANDKHPTTRRTRLHLHDYQ